MTMRIDLVIDTKGLDKGKQLRYLEKTIVN